MTDGVGGNWGVRGIELGSAGLSNWVYISYIF